MKVMPREKMFRIWISLLPAMLVPLLAALFYFVLFSEYYFARVIYGATKCFTVFWPLFAVWLILRRPFGKEFRCWSKHFRALPAGFVSGLAMAGLMFAVMRSPVGEVVVSSSGSIREKSVQLGLIEHYWAFAVFLSVVHSLIEEYYWRWFVFGFLREAVSIPAAHLLAGVSFAAHHIVVATQFFPFFWGIVLGGLVGAGGIVWSVLYSRQKSLAGAWVSHIIADLGIMCIGHKLLFGSYF
jgi:uncharacterized protein